MSKIDYEKTKNLMAQLREKPFIYELKGQEAQEFMEALTKKWNDKRAKDDIQK